MNFSSPRGVFLSPESEHSILVRRQVVPYLSFLVTNLGTGLSQ
jgi:hypothetical protein